MQNREKILGMVLLTTVLLWQAGPVLHNWFIAPIDERLGQIKTIKKRLRKQEDFEFELIQAKSAVKRAERQSLPPNPLDAQRLYQSWLTDLAQLSHLRDPQVRPSRRSAQGDFYVAVQVDLQAEGTYEQLTQFLFCFYRADLLHHLVRLNVESTASQGDPLLNISLTAEGLSLRNAVARKHLFPESKLVTDIDEGDKEITVANIEGFPSKAPFLIRIGKEFLKVTNMREDHRWEVERGSEPTKPVAHAAQSEVQLTPLSKQSREQSWSDFKQHIASNNFIIPAPAKTYTPKLKAITDQQILQGSTFKLKAETDGWDPSWGRPIFKLAVSDNAPAGLMIQSDTGQIIWEVPDKYTPQSIPVTVTASASEQNERQVKTSFQITVLKPNKPPSITKIPDQNVFLGQSWLYAVDANDPEKQNLSFELAGTIPEGMEIDSLTGLLAWSPGQSVKPGTYPIQVVVSDDGTPAQSSTESFNIKLQEDSAQYTYLIACLSVDEDRFAWLYDRANNKKTNLRLGSKFEIADATAKVTNIADDFLLFQIGSATYRISTGENLRAVLLNGPLKPTSEKNE